MTKIGSLLAVVLLGASTSATAQTVNYTCVISKVAHFQGDFLKQKWRGWTLDVTFQSGKQVAKVSGPLILRNMGRPIVVPVTSSSNGSLTFDWTMFGVRTSGRHLISGAMYFQVKLLENSGQFSLQVATLNGSNASRGSGKCTKK